MAVLTATEVCEILGITPNYLYQLQYRKQLQWIEKRGKAAFYNSEDVQAYKLKRVKK